jgi:hypothetical protein
VQPPEVGLDARLLPHSARQLGFERPQQPHAPLHHMNGTKMN